MNAEKFYREFSNLDLQIKELKEESENAKKNLVNWKILLKKELILYLGLMIMKMFLLLLNKKELVSLLQDLQKKVKCF